MSEVKNGRPHRVMWTLSKISKWKITHQINLDCSKRACILTNVIFMTLLYNSVGYYFCCIWFNTSIVAINIVLCCVVRSSHMLRYTVILPKIKWKMFKMMNRISRWSNTLNLSLSVIQIMSCSFWIDGP